MASATACAKLLAVSQSAPAIGKTTCRPLPPVSLTKLCKVDGGEPLTHVARGRDDVGPAETVTGIDVENDAVANLQMIDHRAAHVHFEHARLHQRKQPVQVLDRDDLPLLAVDHGAEIFLGETGRRVLLEEALARRAIGTAHQRQRPVDHLRRHPVPNRAIVIGQILLGDADVGPIDAVGMR